MTAQAARYRLAWLSARRSLKSARTLVVELPCRTVWRDGGEYVEVPIDDLRAAAGGGS